jgi:hypothetical protein
MSESDSVQKIKLRKGREKLFHLRRQCWRSSWIDTDFIWLMSYEMATNLTLDMISLTSYPPSPKFLLLIKMAQGDILWFALTMPDLIVPNRLLCFWITRPYAEHLILLIHRIWPYQTSCFSSIWKECFMGVHLTNMMNLCPLSRIFRGKSIVRICAAYFKNEWSDFKDVLMKMVNMLSGV